MTSCLHFVKRRGKSFRTVSVFLYALLPCVHIVFENYFDIAKLLGINLDTNQKWSSQIKGIGGTISSLKSRLYLLKRLARVICKEKLKKVADSLYTSTIRYGIQLFGKVRLNKSDPTDSLLESLQVTQNCFARFMHGTKLTDHINTAKIFGELNILSVNQINAQTKLLEVWKSQNVPNYPTKWEKRVDTSSMLFLFFSLIALTKRHRCDVIMRAATIWGQGSSKQ